MFFCLFYEKFVSVRERNMKLLLESVNYIAITETVTFILQQKQLRIAESTACIIATETPTYINTMKIVTHKIVAENVTTQKLLTE